MQKVIIHTDGACKGNPGLGAWAATLEYLESTKEICGVVTETTNNKMELQAVIEALNALKYPCHVDIYTDSQYVHLGITKWIHNWKKNGWKKVKNIPQWQEVDRLCKIHTVKWHWVRAHNGHDGNERVDKLANLAIKNFIAKLA